MEHWWVGGGGGGDLEVGKGDGKLGRPGDARPEVHSEAIELPRAGALHLSPQTLQRPAEHLDFEAFMNGLQSNPWYGACVYTLAPTPSPPRNLIMQLQGASAGSRAHEGCKPNFTGCTILQFEPEL